eukprot:sb/3477292/
MSQIYSTSIYIITKLVLLWTVHRAFPVKQKLLNSRFIQISDQVGVKCRLALSASLIKNSADGSRSDFRKIVLIVPRSCLAKVFYLSHSSKTSRYMLNVVVLENPLTDSK